MNYNYSVATRFMRYVQVDTQSDPNATCFPSTEKQKDLARLLAQELKDMGIADVELDEHGYVYASIESNTTKNIPVICFKGKILYCLMIIRNSLQPQSILI